MGIGGPGEAESDETVVKKHKSGPLPALDKLVERTNAGGRLQRLIEQSGVKTTPGAVVLIALVMALAAGVIAGAGDADVVPGACGRGRGRRAALPVPDA